MKVLFLGQAPGAGWDNNSVPLGGRNARKLGSLVSMSGDEFLASFDTANLLNEYPGAAGSGDYFPMQKAKKVAATMRFDEYDLIVMLGRNVQTALGFPAADWFEEINRGKTTFVSFPHPSGRNRWWNSDANQAAATNYLLTALTSS